MQYTQVQINKVDNGYLVTANKVIFGQQQPEQTIKVFHDWEKVQDFLNPKATLASA
jgi:hypothetical protein